jgi:hypothetical protein
VLLPASARFEALTGALSAELVTPRLVTGELAAAQA